MIALVLGTLLAIGALVFVLWPLFSEPRGRSAGGFAAPSSGAGRRASFAGDERSQSQSQSLLESEAIEALREIEFDQATGKLSEADYLVLREKYTGEALAQLRAGADNAAGDGSPTEGGTAGGDEIEALISRFRAGKTACPTCGPRPEPDAIYCSGCGHFLGGGCFSCGAKVLEPGARFCSSCGASLAA